MVKHEEAWNKPTIRYWWCREGLFLFRPRRLLVLLPVKRFLVFDPILPTDLLLLPLAEVIRLSSSEEELGSILGPIVSDASGWISGGHHVLNAEFARPPLHGSGISFPNCGSYPLIVAGFMSLLRRHWVNLFYFPVVMLLVLINFLELAAKELMCWWVGEGTLDVCWLPVLDFCHKLWLYTTRLTIT